MGTTKFGYDYTHAWPYGMHNDELPHNTLFSAHLEV